MRKVLTLESLKPTSDSNSATTGAGCIPLSPSLFDFAQTANVAARHFDRVGIDFYGPLPSTAAGNRWIIVAVDHLTRYDETAALPAASARALRLSFYAVLFFGMVLLANY